MKISVLTATYNRGKFLERIYNSLIRNMTSETEDVEVEWLIMDDGSTDNTKEVVEKFVKREKIDVRERRANCLYSIDEKSTIRKAHENPNLQQVYKEFFEKIGSDTAHKYLHTRKDNQKWKFQQKADIH